MTEATEDDWKMGSSSADIAPALLGADTGSEASSAVRSSSRIMMPSLTELLVRQSVSSALSAFQRYRPGTAPLDFNDARLIAEKAVKTALEIIAERQMHDGRCHTTKDGR